jgi:hypothetical protein
MRLTEHELTIALTGAAKQVMTLQRKDVRKGKVDVDEAWETTDRYQRFLLLDGLGAQLLPVLVALPDVEVEPGARPQFTDAQIQNTVEQVIGDEGGRLRRKAVVAARVALVRAALGHLPPRQDPDALIVPDHL